MKLQVRTAPAGARMAHALSAGKASASQALSLRVGNGQVRHFATAAEMTAAVRRMEMSGAAPAEADPPPNPPNVAPDTGARLDAQDGQLQDHETRIAALEQRSPPPSGLNDGEGAKPAEANAAARPADTMVDSRAIYGRMSAKGATPIPAMPAAIQTSSGPMLDAGAINARHNLATTRAGRPDARVRG